MADLDTAQEGAAPADDSLRGMLTAEFEKAEAPANDKPAAVNGVDGAGASPGVGDAPVAAESEAEAEQRRRGNPYKDPKTGQFTSAPKEAAPKEAAPVKADKTEIPATDNTAKETPKAPSTAPSESPPVSWAADAKAAWNELPPAIKTAVLKRENEVSNGFRQYSEQTRSYERMLSPVAQEAQRMGVTVDHAINSLITAHMRLQNPATRAQAFGELAHTYGYDLGTPTGQQSDAPANGSPAPIQYVTDPRLESVVQFIKAQDDERTQNVVNYVLDFAQSEGHEHFGAVESEIMAMIPAIRQANPGWSHEKVLQDAYDRAVWANPSTRNQILDKQRADGEAKRIADAKTRTNAARIAGSSVTGAPVGSMPPQPKGSLREEIEAAFAGG